jgi:hypothetical protein
MEKVRPSRDLHAWMYADVGIRRAAARPASRPVNNAFKIPDPVNGSTNPSESPAG